jgi:hypothetical protein
VNVIFGQDPAVPGTGPAKLTYNYETEKPRVLRFQRFEPGPAGVQKVGFVDPLAA